MEPGAHGFGAHRMRKGKVPDDITCCFRCDQIRYRTDHQKAGGRYEVDSLEIPA